MTKNEAKKKWCPFARVREDTLKQNTTSTGQVMWGNQVGSITFPQSSYASDPVASAAINRHQYTASSPRPECLCLADQCMAWRSVLNDTDRGYCGLAGFQNSE